MKIKNIEVLPIVIFYAIAIALRLAWILVAEYCNPAFHESYLFSLASGLGPFVGAIVTMAIFKKKMQCSLFGKSAWKSVLTIIVPCIAMCIVGGWEDAWLLFIAFVYGYLEEYGWRGYLQNELKSLPYWQACLIITVMWLLWHCDLDHRNLMVFIPVLLVASFGIGRCAIDTNSLAWCAAFHGIFNFMKNGLFSNTHYLIAFIGIVTFWFILWYAVKPKHAVQKGN